MNDSSRKRLMLGDKKLKPSWDTYHSLGIDLMKALPAHHSLEEIAAVLGTTPQMVWHEAATALGKVAYRMRELTPDWEDHHD